MRRVRHPASERFPPPSSSGAGVDWRCRGNTPSPGFAAPSSTTSSASSNGSRPPRGPMPASPGPGLDTGMFAVIFFSHSCGAGPGVTRGDSRAVRPVRDRFPAREPIPQLPRYRQATASGAAFQPPKVPWIRTRPGRFHRAPRPGPRPHQTPGTVHRGARPAALPPGLRTRSVTHPRGVHGTSTPESLVTRHAVAKVVLSVHACVLPGG